MVSIGKVVKGKNDLWTTAPHIASLLLHSEHGYNLSIESQKKDYFVCPNCGRKIYRWVRTVTRYGLKCPTCSDGVSYPEKFVANLLKQLNIDYVHDNPTEWSGSRRYDFYIEKLSLIIETHGLQHYSDERIFYNRTDYSKRQRVNDVYKKNIALQNGVRNYIELDCRYSEFDYIKNSILNSELASFFDLTLINWDKLMRDCLKSKVMEVCDMYNSGIKSTSKIAELSGLFVGTVTDYLKRCHEANLCDYVPNPLHKRAIICVDTGKVYESLKAVGEDGFNKSQVSECCNHSGRAFTAGGYNWCFLDEYDPNTYVMKVPTKDVSPKKVMWIETGKIYEKLTDCKEDGFLPSSVSGVCNGKLKTHKKQHFKFV